MYIATDRLVSALSIGSFVWVLDSIFDRDFQSICDCFFWFIPFEQICYMLIVYRQGYFLFYETDNM